jgi:cytochrome c oxidase subunit II
MLWRRLRIPGVVLGLTLLWLCVRFPYQAAGIARKLFESPNNVDPQALHLHGEFMESNLGTSVEPDGAVTVRLIAQKFIFVPMCVTVPAGRPVHFRMTSADVVHRFAPSDSDHALEVVPGHVNESVFEFGTPGEYPAPCHEFCGAGHFDMRSRVVVVPENQFAKLGPQERSTCGSP